MTHPRHSIIMRLTHRIALAAAATLIAASTAGAQSESFVVVVNAANPATELPKDAAAKLFMKSVAKWEHGEAVAPICNSASKSVTEAFSKSVLGRSASAVDAHWQKVVFSGKDAAPPDRGTDLEVLALVRSFRGAIAYVSADAQLGPGVKALKLK